MKKVPPCVFFPMQGGDFLSAAKLPLRVPKKLIASGVVQSADSDGREVKVLFEVMEKRSELSKTTIICSQREPNSWASMILNDEVSANSIMKRATKHYTVVIKPQE